MGKPTRAPYSFEIACFGREVRIGSGWWVVRGAELSCGRRVASWLLGSRAGPACESEGAVVRSVQSVAVWREMRLGPDGWMPRFKVALFGVGCGLGRGRGSCGKLVLNVLLQGGFVAAH